MNIFQEEEEEDGEYQGREDKMHQNKGNVTQVYNIKKLRFLGKVEEKLEDAFGDEDPLSSTITPSTPRATKGRT